VTLALFDDDSPRARLDDPLTSHYAADMNDTAGSRRAVLLILQAYRKPLADFEIERIHKDAGGKYTGQRLRTARAELVECGIVSKAGQTTTPHDRRCLLWTMTSPAA
jgi:hypothetical protein